MIFCNEFASPPLYSKRLVADIQSVLSMYDFRTLGGIDLRDGDGVEVRDLLVRPKQIAVLAHLAVITDPPLQRRDTLLSLFWPESDARRARASLRSTLYQIRKVLGDDAIVVRGDEEIGINRAVIRCDAAEFERLAAEGRAAEALSLYRGPLLDGLFVPNAGEFERWLDRQRDRLERIAVELSRREEIARPSRPRTVSAGAAAAGPPPPDALRQGRRVGAGLRWIGAALIALMVTTAAFMWRIAPRQDSTPIYRTASEALSAGDRMLQDGRYNEAVGIYRQAVAADSSLAVAYYRLGLAAWYTGQIDLARQSLSASLTHGKLSYADSLAAEGFGIYLAGVPEAARVIFDRLVHTDSMRSDGWLGIGELGFHYGPSLGIHPDSAAEAFKRVLRIEPRNTSAKLHLLRLAARRHAGHEVDSIYATIELSADVRPEADGIRATMHGDSAALRTLQSRELARYSDVVFARGLSGTTDSPFPAEQLLAVMEGHYDGRRSEIAARVMRVMLAYERRNPDVADRELRAIAEVTPPRADELRALWLILPDAPADSGQLSDMETKLRAPAPGDAGIGPGDDQIALVGIYPPRRVLLRALIALRRHDPSEAARLADTLIHWPIRNSVDTAFAAHYGAIVRASILRGAGRPGPALAALGDPAGLPDHTLPQLMSYPAAYERWLRMDLSGRVGRWREAMAWAAGFPDPAGYDFTFVPLARR